MKEDARRREVRRRDKKAKAPALAACCETSTRQPDREKDESRFHEMDVAREPHVSTRLDTLGDPPKSRSASRRRTLEIRWLEQNKQSWWPERQLTNRRSRAFLYRKEDEKGPRCSTATARPSDPPTPHGDSTINSRAGVE